MLGKRAKRILGLIDEEEDDEYEKKKKVIVFVAAAISCGYKFHSPALFRKRWDSKYLLNLAINENSFISEYRLNPASFDLLHDILKDQLQVNESKAKCSMSKTGSAPITTLSRLGAVLIELGGGRRMEAMRTHGLCTNSPNS